MEADEIRAFRETAQRFAQREVRPILDGETRDGDLGSLPTVLDHAETAGLLPGDPGEEGGREYGVWGRSCLAEGPGFSLVVLEEVARVCAGVAACLHFASLGSLECLSMKHVPKRATVAIFEPQWHLTWETLGDPPAHGTRVEGGKDSFRVSGTKSFVQAPPHCEGFVVYGRGDSGWEALFVPNQTPGLVLSPVGMRTGLAALEVVHLSLEHASAGPDQLLPTRGLYPVLRRLLLGICAIAVGNARGALETAASYATERYQGGDQIERHPAVLGLLGEAASRVFAGAAQLASEADQTVDSRRALWRALAAKLRIAEDCCQAVTDCLQVLGGYGYMEDYGLEKRLRDAMTLKSLGIRADDLRILCATADVWGWDYGA